MWNTITVLMLIQPLLLYCQQEYETRQTIIANWKNEPIEYYDGQILVKLRDGVRIEDASPALSRYQAHITLSFNLIRWHLVELPTGTDIFPILNALEQEPLIEAVMPNAAGSGLWSPNDPYFRYGNQWYLVNPGQWPPSGTPGADIHVSQAWEITRGSPNVIIGVLDSGIPLVNGSLSHPDLNDTNKFILGPDYIDTLGSDRDNYGHGTMVTGAASAETNNNIGIAGIAGNSRVMVIKALGDNNLFEIVPLFVGDS